MKRWTEKWSSFPAAHKRRCLQALGLYALIVAATAAWVGLRASATAEDWEMRSPAAVVTLKSVYLTPQIAETPVSQTPDAETPDTATASDPALPPPDDATGDETAAVTPTPPAPVDTPSFPPVADDGQAYVAIIVSGLGLSALDTERALEDLPPQVTLAFSPYGQNISTWVRKAVAGQREALMLVPMETANYPQEDPGPRALSSRFSDDENNESLKWLLKEGSGAAGVMNLMGSRFMADKKRLAATFGTLRESNTLFVETPGIARSAAATVAAKVGIPYLAANLQIDAIATDQEIRKQLEALEQTAREKGYAIGLAQPYPLTMNVIKSWSAGLGKRGVTLAPLKTIYKNKPRYVP